MDLVKAYCPQCHKNHSKSDPILVNPDDKNAVCPDCLAEFKTKQGIKLFENHIALLLHDAYYTLEQINDYNMAYHKFADIIEIDPSCCAAREGRIISLIYLSTFKYCQIENAKILFEKDLGEYLRYRPKKLLPFMKRVNETLNVYQSNLYNKLSNQGLFYTLDGLRIYYSHCYEILSVKILLLDLLERLSARAKDPTHINELIERISKEYEDLSNFLNRTEFYSPAGDIYNVISYNPENGEVLITRSVPAFDTSKVVKRYGTTSYFNKKEKRKKKAVLFHSRSALYTFMNSLISLGWLCFVLAFLSIINTFLVIFFTDISYLPFIFGPLAILLIILGLVCLFVHRNKFHQYFKDDEE
ncbi:MAG: hypothetical protein LUB56_01885 [Coprobacillus sp.]|nr:hypothetical protein [Coprobacillus sp.]